MVIYIIRCSANNKVYIGQTIKSFKRRLDQHFSALKIGNHKNKHLQAAFNLYGMKSFSADIIEDVLDVNLIDEAERKYIEVFQANKPEYGFNFESGGNKYKNFSSPLKGKKIPLSHRFNLYRAKAGKSYKDISYKNCPKRKVLARNVITGFEICFFDMKKCSEFIGCSASAVRCHIERKTKLIKKTWQVSPVSGGSY